MCIFTGDLIYLKMSAQNEIYVLQRKMRLRKVGQYVTPFNKALKSEVAFPWPSCHWTLWNQGSQAWLDSEQNKTLHSCLHSWELLSNRRFTLSSEGN